MKKDLDILLIHPNASKRIYQDLSKDYSAIEPPVWAAMLANALRVKGHEVGILDCEAEGLNPKTAAKIVNVASPKIVAVVVYGQQPSASTQNMDGAVSLMKELEQYGLMKIYIGAHPSALPERTVLDDKFSFVCEGEGLYTLDALAKVDFFEEELDTVPGLWWYDHETKEVMHTDPAPLISNLDEELPGMAWDLLPMDKYRTSNWHSWSNNNDRTPFASIYTSLGCPYKCTFCMINAPFGTAKYRHWSPEFIIEQFAKIAEMGIKNVKIADELFVLKPAHFMKVCELIIERGYDFNIWAYSRIDTVKKKYLQTLKKAGVNWLALGIESANTTVRRDVVKGKFEDVDIKQIVGEIKAEGINVIGNFIVGLPEDNHDTMQQTLDLALDLKCDMLNIYSAMAYPGSKLYDNAIETNAELPDSWLGYSQHAFETRPLDTKYVTGSEVLAFRDAAFTTYFDDKKYLEYMRGKFGEETYNLIVGMNKHKLKRSLV